MDFSLAKTLSMLVKTAPFIVLRLVVFLTITLAYVIVTSAWAYLAAWDVRHAKLHGRRELKTGITPFGLLLNQFIC